MNFNPVLGALAGLEGLNNPPTTVGVFAPHSKAVGHLGIFNNGVLHFGLPSFPFL